MLSYYREYASTRMRYQTGIEMLEGRYNELIQKSAFVVRPKTFQPLY